MVRLMLSLYDTKAESYLQPFFVPTVGVAYRDIMRALQDPENPIAQFAKDFELWHLGNFDDESGFVYMEDGKGFPVKLCNVGSLQAPKE